VKTPADRLDYSGCKPLTLFNSIIGIRLLSLFQNDAPPASRGGGFNVNAGERSLEGQTGPRFDSPLNVRYDFPEYVFVTLNR